MTNLHVEQPSEPELDPLAHLHKGAPILKLFTPEEARAFRVIPLEENGEDLVVAIGPGSATETLEARLQRPFIHREITTEQMDAALDRLYPAPLLPDLGEAYLPPSPAAA